MELAILHRSLASRKRRVIQDCVQRFQQLLGTFLNSAQEVALLFVHVGFSQQVRHSDQTAQRCADLMVQTGQKLPLEALELDVRRILILAGSKKVLGAGLFGEAAITRQELNFGTHPSLLAYRRNTRTCLANTKGNPEVVPELTPISRTCPE